MKKLCIQFQDGSIFWGDFHLYRSGLYGRESEVTDQINYSTNNSRTLLYYWDQISFIRQDGLKFLYNKSSVIKISDLTESEYIDLIRSNKLGKIGV